MNVKVEIGGNVYRGTISVNKANMSFVLSVPGLSKKFEGDNLLKLALSIPLNINVFPDVTFKSEILHPQTLQ